MIIMLILSDQYKTCYCLVYAGHEFEKNSWEVNTSVFQLWNYDFAMYNPIAFKIRWSDLNLIYETELKEKFPNQ